MATCGSCCARTAQPAGALSRRQDWSCESGTVGRPLETQEDSSGSSMQSSYASLEANASVLVFGLPDSGDIDVEVSNIANLEMDSPLLPFRDAWRDSFAASPVMVASAKRACSPGSLGG